MTDQGTNIVRAQWFFWGIYLVFQFVVLSVYRKTRPHAPWLAVLLCLSKRMHSIFVLRLFNDPVAMLFAHGAIWCFASHRWLLGSVLYSLGVGIKMNVLLFAPALLLLYIRNTGILGTFVNLSVCACLQLAVGAPFLLYHPVSYLSKAFELSRVFFYEWTVNFRFLPEHVFVSKQLALLLLCLHLGVLALVIVVWTWRVVKAGRGAGPGQGAQGGKGHIASKAEDRAELVLGARTRTGTGTGKDTSGGSSGGSRKRWLCCDPCVLLEPSAVASERSFEALAQLSDEAGAVPEAGVAIPFKSSSLSLAPSMFQGSCRDSPLFIASLLYASNFIGVAFARTLHYQFYSWYTSSVPLLLGASGAPAYVVLVASGLLELAFLTFPSTSESSLALHMGHLLVLGAVLSARPGSISLPWSNTVTRRVTIDTGHVTSEGGHGCVTCVGGAVARMEQVLRGMGGGSGAAWEAGDASPSIEIGWHVRR